jgi:hypothetical protein
METSNNHSKNMITPYSPLLVETLQTIIAPGRRARVSPFIKAAQFQVLESGTPLRFLVSKLI